MITRFSVALPKGLKTPRSALFNSTRLDHRFKLFERYYIPGINAQTTKNFTLILVVDPGLPTEYLTKIKSLVSAFRQKTIIHTYNPKEPLESTEWLRPYPISSSISASVTITTRIDDDDSIHPRFIELLQRTASSVDTQRPEPWYITIPDGQTLNVETGETHRIDYECIALGLSLVTPSAFPRNVYGYNHTKIKRMLSGVSLKTPHHIMYTRTLHPQRDSIIPRSRSIKHTIPNPGL